MTDQPEVTGSEAVSDTSELSLEEARNLIYAEEPTAESAEEATAEPELSDEDNAAPEKATGEDEEAAPAETPPRELPRSWTKDQNERWNKLDPDMQEFLLEQDRKASAVVRQSQNEHAEKLKGLTAKEQQTEQLRQQFEVKIKSALEVLEREQLRDFADIKSMADIEKLALEDPFRKIQWDVHQQKMQAVAWESQQAEGRKTQEHQTQWAQHIKTEDALAAELIPELADKVKGPALIQRAAGRLAELGFKPEELNDLASGKEKLSIYDHRIQQLIFSDLRLSDIQNAPKAVAAKPVPLVQRPGVSRPAGSADSENLQALEAKLTQSGSLKDAEALLNAQIRSRRRSA
jgi:hypothetical protein